MSDFNCVSFQSYELVRERLFVFFEKILDESKRDHLGNKITYFLNSPRTYKDFQNFFPIQDKENLFGADKVIGKGGGTIIASAGTTFNNITFRVSEGDSPSNVVNLSKLLLNKFNLSAKSTLVVSAYPTRLDFPSEINVLECAGRPDIFERFLEMYARQFDKIVLVCLPIFINYLTKWSDQLTNNSDKFVFVTGGSPLYPELVRHVGRAANSDFTNRWINLFGVAEVTPGFAAQLDITSPFFSYSAEDYFIEEIDKQLVVTYLKGSTDNPLVRYSTGDLISLLRPGQFQFLSRVNPLDQISNKVLKAAFGDQDLAPKITGRIRVDSKNVLIETWSDTKLTESDLALVRSSLSPDYNCAWVNAPSGAISNSPWDQIDLLKKGRSYG